MENHHYLKQIIAFAQAVIQKKAQQKEVVSLSNCGFVCCRRRQYIHRVPFLKPSLILVLKGEKTISNGEKTSTGTQGQFFGIPAPASFDMINDPDESDQYYMALFIPFETQLINRFLRLHSGLPNIQHSKAALQIQGTPTLFSSVIHFLEIADAPGQDRLLLEHRLMEILLCLVKISGASHMLLSISDEWSKRLTSLFLTDPAKSWRIQDVSRLLAVSESTLRRHLRKENTSYQAILDDVRLGHGLTQIQMTQLPVGQIAGNCGYQSLSRFSERFSKRFRITPSQLRKTMTVSG
jgi:AraC-like DNA-binding protein